MDIDSVARLVAVLNEYPVSEIAVEAAGRRIHVRRSAAASAVSARSLPDKPPEPPAEALPTEEAYTLTAGMVGLFHHTEPPVGYAQVVAPAQTVGGIEAMKLVTDVVVETGGRVIEVLIEDGAPVEYGQPLFRLVPDSAGAPD